MNTTDDRSKVIPFMSKLWGRGRIVPEVRYEPQMSIPACSESDLFLRVDKDGFIMSCSAALEQRISLDSRVEQRLTVADLVMQAIPWLKDTPDHWPRQLPVLEFRTVDDSRMVLGGWLWQECDDWVILFIDFSGPMERLNNLERRSQLTSYTGQVAVQLRGRVSEPALVVADWLESLSLRLQIPWLAVAVSDGEQWRVFQQYQRQADGSALLSVRELGIAARGDAGALPAQWLNQGGEQIWGVPYSEEGQTQAWLCCGGFVARESAAWLGADDWQQLFAQVAAPIARYERSRRALVLRQRYETLEHLTSGGWWEYHPESQTLHLAPGLGSLLGVHEAVRTSLQIDHWLQLLDPMDRDEFVVKLAATEATGAVFLHSLRVQIQGASCWYSFEGRVVGQGAHRRILGFALDINSIRKREAEADVSKARLAGLIDSAPGIIYLQRYDEGTLHLVFFSASLEALLGWTQEEMRAAPYATFVHPDDREGYFEKSRQLLQQGRASSQYRIRNKAGDYRWMQDEVRLLRNDRGIPTEVVGLCLDVTETKEAVERVFRSEESYRALVDDSPAIICRYKPDLQVTFANPMLAASLNIEPHQVEGLNLGDYLSPEQREQALERLRGLEPANPIVSSEICINRSDLDHRWWVIYERGLFDEQGCLLEVQAVGRDNTEVHQTRHQLFQSAKMATLGEMATGLAHEINQPLSVIHMTLTNLLGRIDNGTVTPDYLKEKIQRIAGQVQRAAGIVNHVRVFGRRSDLESVTFNPSASVDGALSLLGQKLRALEVFLDVSLDALPSVKGHPDRLEQVLINLIMNACYAVLERKKKQTDMKPSIRITGMAFNDSVHIAVEDNGGGVKPALIERIFEPFFTTKPVDHGTGLGLSVSYEIIRQMSGNLLVENIAEGAKFIIKLPVIPHEDVVEKISKT